MHLVKMDKNVYWEDLHRGGSVLYVKNITVKDPTRSKLKKDFLLFDG